VIIKANAKSLSDAVKTAARGCPTRSPIEATRSIKVVSSGGIVTFIGTNTQAFVAYKLQCECDGDGAMLIPPSGVQAICRIPNDAEVLVQSTDSGILVRSGKNRFEIPTEQASIHPGKVVEFKDSYHEVSVSDLVVAIRRAGIAAAGVGQSVTLTGVSVGLRHDGVCEFMAMDRKRISIHDIQGKSFGQSTSGATTVLDLDGLKSAMLSISSTGESVAKIHAGVSMALIQCGQVTCGVPMLEGVYPNVRGSLREPVSGSAIFKVKAGSLLEACRVTSIFSEHESKGVHIESSGPELAMRKNSVGGGSEVFINVDGNGNECSTILDVSYLTEWLSSVPGDEVVTGSIPPDGATGPDMAVTFRLGKSLYLASPMVAGV
jgi:DNA polymerase III subunit beta